MTAVARKLCVTFHGFYLDEHRVQGDAPKQQFADFRRANRLAPYAGEPGPRGPGSAEGRMTAATACRMCGTEPREGARFCDGMGLA